MAKPLGGTDWLHDTPANHPIPLKNSHSLNSFVNLSLSNSLCQTLSISLMMQACYDPRAATLYLVNPIQTLRRGYPPYEERRDKLMKHMPKVSGRVYMLLYFQQHVTRC